MIIRVERAALKTLFGAFDVSDFKQAKAIRGCIHMMNYFLDFLAWRRPFFELDYIYNGLILQECLCV